MADEAKLRDQQNRGARAEAILKDPLVKEAFEAVQKIVDDGWKSSRADESEQRENAYLMHRLLQQFESYFTVLIRNGEQAGKDLLRIKDESKFKKMLKR